MTDPCGAVRGCGRPPGHRGHHGGFRSLDRSEQLTPRERQVVELFARGFTWNAAAHELGISRNTISHYRASVSRKYGVTCLVELLEALGWLRIPAR